jgi:hypothetical protein
MLPEKTCEFTSPVMDEMNREVLNCTAAIEKTG